MLTYTVYQRFMPYSLTTCHSAIYCTTLKGKKKSSSITICSQRIIKREKKKKIYFWTSSFKSIISYNKWMHSVCISFEILSIYFFNLYKKKKSLHVSKVLSPFLPSRSFIFRHYHGEFVSLVETKLNNWKSRILSNGNRSSIFQ